jgi:hypothetical protein
MRTANILRIAIPFLDPNRESLKRRGAEILILGYTNTLPELNGGRVNVRWGGYPLNVKLFPQLGGLT